MRTIDSILEYNFSTEQIHRMLEMKIINGCGGWKGADFEPLMRDIIHMIPGYNGKKGAILFGDIREICYEHDYDFHNKKGFFLSNLKMAWKICKLLHWTGYRFLVAFILFLGLCIYGKKYY